MYHSAIEPSLLVVSYLLFPSLPHRRQSRSRSPTVVLYCEAVFRIGNAEPDRISTLF